MDIPERCFAYKKLLEDMFQYLQHMKDVNHGWKDKTMDTDVRRYYEGSSDLATVVYDAFHERFERIGKGDEESRP